MLLSKACTVISEAICSIKLPTITLPSLPELPKQDKTKEEESKGEENAETGEKKDDKDKTELIQDNTVEKSE